MPKFQVTISGQSVGDNFSGSSDNKPDLKVAKLVEEKNLQEAVSSVLTDAVGEQTVDDMNIQINVRKAD